MALPRKQEMAAVYTTHNAICKVPDGSTGARKISF